jgi:SNF2 family DNA or RNA helicase
MVETAIKVSVANGIIRLVADKESAIFKWEQRIYLVNILGFERDEEASDLHLNVGSGVDKKLQETLDYLREKNITFELDEKASELASRVEDEHKRFEKSKETGSELKKNRATILTVPGFKRPLKPYQIPAVAHLSSLDGAANFSVPGSGKTSIVLAAYAILKERGEVNRLVVIGPRACFMPWEDEYEACFGKKPHTVRISGIKTARPGLYRDATNADLVLLSYQMAANDQQNVETLLRQSNVMLILDESHNIKRLEGGRWADVVLSLAPFAKRRVILTGTPIPNSIQDIWSQVAFLWPNEPVLGEREHFKYQFDKNPAALEEQVRRELGPLYWRIHKRELGLPNPQFHRISVELSPYQTTIYRALATKILSEVVHAPEDRLKLRPWRKARMVRLLQAASNPSLLKENSPEFQIPPLEATGLSIMEIIDHYSNYEKPKKLLAVEKLVRTLVSEKKEKVVVWTSFVHNIETLRNCLADLNPMIIHGGIPKDDKEDEEINRERIIRDFKTRDACKLLIVNPGACAESISLHKVCMHAIYVDRTFNGAHYMQSLDRIHRVGLEPNDHVHYWIFLSKNTIDEIIDSRLEEKQNRMLRILDEDFSVLDLDVDESAFSEEIDEEKDFEAVIAGLKKELEQD